MRRIIGPSQTRFASLSTNDAHSLYQKFGFETDGRYMRLERNPAA
ncbi:hypothetical protein RFM99_02620 [Mesorhizobium sp. VK4C]|nr:hypothetical protein [Mesorhizobium sp. VK4C]MDX8497303.1 hypothetical protein [Mesorhizobium sp. VK4C]